MNNLKNKIYFFDVDGTLASSKSDISSEMAYLLSRLSTKTNVAIISGAKLKQLIEQVIIKLDDNANLKNIYLLPTSGGSLYTYNNGWNIQYENLIPKEDVERIEKLIYKSFEHNKIKLPTKTYGERLEYRGSQITFSVLGQKAPIEVKSKWDKNHKKRKKIISKLEMDIPEYDIKIGGTTSIDITVKGIDKAYGINKLCAILNVEPEECTFVGDAIFKGGNDYSVIKTGINIIHTSGENDTKKIINGLIKASKIKKMFNKLVFYIKKIISFIKNIFSPKKYFKKIVEFKEGENVYVTRSHKNPVLSPTEYSWENEGVFNPAAIYIGGRVHILYRALGSNGMSTIGYASSSDGVHFDERLPYPIFHPKNDFEINKNNNDKRFNPDKYTSGGGWCGCEDPKVTKIGDRIFLTYVAFSGWHSIRVAMTSISVDDFLNKRWNWSRPVLCSNSGVISKSGGLFPEKVKGKYVFFQRIFPDILLDYFDNLRFDEQKNHGEHRIPPRKKGWDSRKISFGSTPIKTKHGWLVITHGVDDAADHQYHMGAMLLGLDNPEKVLYRTNKPILSPDLWYENDWKPGVVYPCGAVNKDGTLLVYYGGGDKYVCVASAPFDDFIDSMIDGKTIKLKTQKVKFKKRKNV
jgi:HAD superfamily hydrolase (TIGR01484 family)